MSELAKQLHKHTTQYHLQSSGDQIFLNMIDDIRSKRDAGPGQFTNNPQQHGISFDKPSFSLVNIH
jgi:hypothetical protein